MVDARAHAHVLDVPTFAMHLAFTTSLIPLRARASVRRVAKVKKNVSASMFAFEAGRQYQAERLSRSIDEDDWEAPDTRRGSTSRLPTPRQPRYADAPTSEKRAPSYRPSSRYHANYAPTRLSTTVSADKNNDTAERGPSLDEPRGEGDLSNSAVSRRSAPKTLFSIRNKRVEEARDQAAKASAEAASASASGTRDAYAWAREDQARHLSASSSKRRSKPLVTRYVDGDSPHDAYFDWSSDDQHVEVVNRALETALADAAAQCAVQWVPETVWTSGDPLECEKDVDAVMRVVAAHVDLSEASDVVRELIDAGGGNAAKRVREWCAEHVDAPNARALAAVVDEIFGAGHPGSPGLGWAGN